jgi:5'-3' exonuclease
VKQKGRRAKLINNMDKARLSRQLVDLERAIPMDKMTFNGSFTSAAELRMAPLDGDRLLVFYDSMGLKDLKRRVEAGLNQQKTASEVAAKGKRYYSKRTKAQIPTPDDYKDVPS